MVAALADRPVDRLDRLPRFIGSGIYLLYYNGDSPPYELLADQNAELPEVPIYVGTAVPAGSRKGRVSTIEAPQLATRLREHRPSIEAASTTLDVSHFWVRHLVTKPIWILRVESLMIARYAPLWNGVVEGFGVKAQGSEREQGSLSMWDTLHPGRKRQGLPYGRGADEMAAMVEEHLRQRYE